MSLLSWSSWDDANEIMKRIFCMKPGGSFFDHNMGELLFLFLYSTAIAGAVAAVTAEAAVDFTDVVATDGAAEAASSLVFFVVIWVETLDFTELDDDAALATEAVTVDFTETSPSPTTGGASRPDFTDEAAADDCFDA
jgi:hypothetical protein